MTEQEKRLLYKTSIILNKDTSQMRLNDIIEELVYVIEQKDRNKTAEQIARS
ncbi:hypothetical protein [Cytobacillus oceanisediminis]|uniref:hypothetical protein n=1 Tax=Cytobacillus oceanisediminis TaxID=665099 RepID=UPI001C23CCE1|nr:hypothetical protein [Cytobacillus oceanisediminis]MBU8773240.1 hypothetical protein [Cytobacillus oceanisediminis]